jgi:cytochrome o ubiquinol oxidase subunit 2
VLALEGCAPAGGVFDPQGPVGLAQKTITIDALVIMLAIVIPTIAVACIFAVWYRASNSRAKYLPDWDYSGRLEVIVWSIPLLTILFLAGMIWEGSYRLDPFRPLPAPPSVQTEEVQVVALDWKWLFVYPREGVASVNQVVVPAGVPVRFHITSGSVMNTFFVPQLGGMIYAMHGMETQLHLQADKPGSYYGRSAQFSGDGFPDMHFQLHAVPRQAFHQWVAATRAAGPVLDQAGYERLAQQSSNVRPFTYSGVEPGLFDRIAARQIPPAPGPQAGGGGRPQVAEIRAKGQISGGGS